ncbi:16S rRNA (cytidine(1402)-2'-O)-methyltransferase [Aestuariimicrobium sp. p3-SID1156]|uniref:16S rRNA (cytidine(1402)-2'-O)-methyltransferase n=1 Tax=Aestuariimicrobium sp. p3-SID1156 TaxID=2916038 RepID=UPI00223BFAD2|nr:16S rRNA (cytidine(1402)-2'-O)-methyltransferase [Aestuariimicrobium sp. p3-SID1156]MCT1460077.1 16S rRNA (cytidine(1402)-2'-O)-methyltransferase [Aestuariimicrobium sp. p3-SID1156]
MVSTQSGRVILAGTPIGDKDSASPALRRAIEDAALVAAEDTRRFHDLLRRLGITTSARIVSYFEGNESERTPELVEALQSGTDVLVVTDAGMPLVSDPGYRLVQAALAVGVPVTAVPGPSAVLTALAVSGLATDRFCFEGFLPRKEGPRRRRLEELAHEPRTMVFFEAPHRLAEFLDDAAGALGADRPGAVCRELTKTHEEVVRLPLGELAEWAREHARGEVTVVIAGAPDDGAEDVDPVELVRVRIGQGEKLSAAVAEVAAATGTNRKQLYAAALADRDQTREEKP